MPRITRVYTRTGDKGTTGLGGGQRVEKDSLRIEAYGTVDELNCILGLVLVSSPCREVALWVRAMQNELFTVGSDLCILEEDKLKYPVPKIEQAHIDAMESIMDTCSKDLKPLEEFVLPGGSEAAAFLHQARTVCRRAERLCVSLGKVEAMGAFVVPYLNRLSDTLFVLARYENHKKGIAEPVWIKP